jgi:hypothetical protein
VAKRYHHVPLCPDIIPVAVSYEIERVTTEVRESGIKKKKAPRKAPGKTVSTLPASHNTRAVHIPSVLLSQNIDLTGCASFPSALLKKTAALIDKRIYSGYSL